jgi:KipI family sensor histidine kinase inhibitor
VNDASFDPPGPDGADGPMPRLLPFGDRAVLAELDSLEAVMSLAARLAASRPAGVVDIVPAARTVLVRIDPRLLQLSAARAWISRTAGERDAIVPRPGPVVELDVVYDGADLAVSAELLGLSVEELVGRHTASPWTVAFTGFAPGFGYLVRPDWTFDVPRLDTPRTRVPAGAVGVAGEFTGVYPRETPGGWRLLGSTTARLFDPAADPPALLAPGTVVRFRDATASGAAARAARGSEPSLPPSTPSPTLAATADPTASSTDPAAASADPAAATADPAASSADPAAATDDRAAASAALAAATAGAHPGAPASAPEAGMRVLAPGLLATVQDLGRAGHAGAGIAPSGALDRGALRAANRLVGNPEHAAAVEVTLGGFRAVAERELWVAVAGAWGGIRLDGRDVDPYEALLWPRGAELSLDWFDHGTRAYVAVRGGVDAARVVGSRSTDILSGLGPAPLQAGDEVPIGRDATAEIPIAAVSPWSAPHDELIEVELAPGPRVDWFAPAGLRALFEGTWTVTAQADRVGVRLEGPAIERIRTAELPSEGMVPGALQVPPGGRPTILLADGPVTGGYPVVAVVAESSLDAVGQARAGTRILFRHGRPLD